jgi:predicted cation transporter
MGIHGSSAVQRSTLSARVKLGLGSSLAALGAATIVLSQLLGWTELSRPWSFAIGLAGGLASGAGAALAVCGLLATRRGR